MNTHTDDLGKYTLQRLTLFLMCGEIVEFLISFEILFANSSIINASIFKLRTRKSGKHPLA